MKKLLFALSCKGIKPTLSLEDGAIGTYCTYNQIDQEYGHQYHKSKWKAFVFQFKMWDCL